MEERFPDYNVVIEYMSTSNIAAKIKTEGKNTACDIIWSLEYGYLDQLNADGLVAPLSATAIDNSIYSEDNALGRMIMPEEIAEYAKLLVSDSGKFVIGETIYISGGRGNLYYPTYSNNK